MPRSPLAVRLMELLPTKIKEEDLQVGDHICTDRNVVTYYHHGIYIGNDRVIHFSKVSTSKPPREEDKCYHLEDTTKDEKSGVRMCCLKCFVRRKPWETLHPHSLYIFKYGESLTLLSPINLGGSHHQSSDPSTVVERATAKLREDDFGTYNLEFKNCETFAFYCKTGQCPWYRSKQVLAAALLAVAVV